jgi:sortase (surface protein transpeptidase)
VPRREAAQNEGLPVRLIVPKLQINAAVEFVGVTSMGAMDVPADITEAGWYKYGAHPGENGSAVIAGHLDGKSGEPGVFIKLDKLQLGDGFSVLDDTGKTTSFVVRRIQAYSQDALPEEVFHSNRGAHLNLITCTGAWDRASKSFSNRLVVFADKVD